MKEAEAHYFLSLIEDILITKIKGKDDYLGFKYLAIKKSLSNFYFELGYAKNFINSDKLEDLKQLVLEKLPVYVTLITSEIDTHNTTSHCIKPTIKPKSILNAGDEIEGFATGTLGGLVKLKNHKGTYLISNAHVLIGKSGKLGGAIKNHKGQTIAKVFWGIFNEYYDIAMAKIKNAYKITEYNFSKIVKPSFDHLEIKSIGMYGEESGKIYSTNALVKVKNYFFKNQILISHLNFTGGDSGSIIVEKEKPNNIIGLYLGGNNQIKVANNLYNLFIKNNTVKDNFENKHEVQLKSFINH